MIVLRVIVFLLGAALAIWTLMSAIRTVILPRSARAITRVVFLVLRAPRFGGWPTSGANFASADQVMALYAPVALVTLVAVWLLLITVGYTRCSGRWTTDRLPTPSTWRRRRSRHWVLPRSRLPEQLLAFTSAGVGLFILTLMITYLPTMYSAFSRRETMVALLEVRAGTPPSAAEFLLRHHRIGWLEEMDETWLDWETLVRRTRGSPHLRMRRSTSSGRPNPTGRG